MIYLYSIGYLLVALLLNAFARASYIKDGTNSWVYRCEIVYAQNYFMLNTLSLLWPLAICFFGFILIVFTCFLPSLKVIMHIITNPLTNMFLFIMEDDRKTKKLQNKKDNTPTTF